MVYRLKTTDIMLIFYPFFLAETPIFALLKKLPVACQYFFIKKSKAH